MLAVTECVSADEVMNTLLGITFTVLEVPTDDGAIAGNTFDLVSAGE